MSHPLATQIRIADEVVQERIRQDERWGEQNHADGTGPIRFAGAATYTEWANYYKKLNGERPKPRWAYILLEEVYEALAEDDPAKLRAELIQVAAVATCWVEAIDRRAK